MGGDTASLYHYKIVCTVIMYAVGEADGNVVEAALTMSSFKSTALMCTHTLWTSHLYDSHFIYKICIWCIN